MKNRKNQKQDDIYDYIVEYIKIHGYPPSVREIGAGVGLHSSSSVHAHLCRMMAAGILETDAELGSPRAIRVPGFRFMPDENADT